MANTEKKASEKLDSIIHPEKKAPNWIANIPNPGLSAPNPEAREVDKLRGQFLFKPIKKTWLSTIDPKHDGAVVFDKAGHMFSPERDKNSGIVKTGLTDRMARELEVEMGLKPMELSPYNHAYWGDFKKWIRTTKEGSIIDCSTAIGKIQYSYASASSKVALSYTEAENDPFAEYVLTSKEVEAKSGSDNAKVKMEATMALGKMSFEEMIEFLKVWQEGRHKVSKAATSDLVFSTIFQAMENSPQQFLDLLRDPNYTSMILLQDCVHAGLIKKSGSAYFILGGDKLGFSYLDAVINLQKPEYNEMRISLMSKLEAAKG